MSVTKTTVKQMESMDQWDWKTDAPCFIPSVGDEMEKLSDKVANIPEFKPGTLYQSSDIKENALTNVPSSIGTSVSSRLGPSTISTSSDQASTLSEFRPQRSEEGVYTDASASPKNTQNAPYWSSEIMGGSQTDSSVPVNNYSPVLSISGMNNNSRGSTFTQSQQQQDMIQTDIQIAQLKVQYEQELANKNREIKTLQESINRLEIEKAQQKVQSERLTTNLENQIKDLQGQLNLQQVKIGLNNTTLINNQIQLNMPQTPINPPGIAHPQLNIQQGNNGASVISLSTGITSNLDLIKNNITECHQQQYLNTSSISFYPTPGMNGTNNDNININMLNGFGSQISPFSNNQQPPSLQIESSMDGQHSIDNNNNMVENNIQDGSDIIQDNNCQSDNTITRSNFQLDPNAKEFNCTSTPSNYNMEQKDLHSFNLYDPSIENYGSRSNNVNVDVVPQNTTMLHNGIGVPPSLENCNTTCPQEFGEYSYAENTATASDVEDTGSLKFKDFGYIPNTGVLRPHALVGNTGMLRPSTESGNNISGRDDHEIKYRQHSFVDNTGMNGPSIENNMISGRDSHDITESMAQVNMYNHTTYGQETLDNNGLRTDTVNYSIRDVIHHCDYMVDSKTRENMAYVRQISQNIENQVGPFDQRARKVLESLAPGDAREALCKLDESVRAQGGICRNVSALLMAMCRKFTREKKQRISDNTMMTQTSDGSTNENTMFYPDHISHGQSPHGLPTVMPIGLLISNPMNINRLSHGTQNIGLPISNNGLGPLNDNFGSTHTMEGYRDSGVSSSTLFAGPPSYPSTSMIDDSIDVDDENLRKIAEAALCEDDSSFEGKDCWSYQKLDNLNGFKVNGSGVHFEIRITLTGPHLPPFTSDSIAILCQWLQDRCNTARKKDKITGTIRTYLDFSYCNLSDDLLKSLLSALTAADCTVITFNLQHNSIGCRGVRTLISYFRKAMSNNAFDSPCASDAEDITPILLKNLNMEHNNIDYTGVLEFISYFRLNQCHDKEAIFIRLGSNPNNQVKLNERIAKMEDMTRIADSNFAPYHWLLPKVNVHFGL